MSTDDPPVITALAPGSAKIWAGDISVPVTVYSGTSLPAGTPIWSLPVGSGSSNLSLVPAVPSDSGADVFALDDSGTLTAVASDGTPVWKVSGIPQRATTWGSGDITVERATITPDFSGSAVVMAPYSFSEENGCITHFTHKASQINTTSGQLVDLHVFSDHRLPGTTSGCPANAGIYSDNNTTEVLIPHPSGPVFIQDNATIIAIDPSTAQPIATATLDPSTINGIPNPDSLPTTIGKMIVAGDGNAYVPYIFSETQSNSLSGVETIHTLAHLMLLHMSPDGTNAKTELTTWTQDFTHTPTGDGSCNCFQESTRGTIGAMLPQAAITNADTGVTIFASYQATCSDRVHTDTSDQTTQCGDNTQFSLMTSISQGIVSAQVNQIPVTTFVPALQRENGSYVGTIEGSAGRLATISGSGTLLWQTSIVDSAGNPASATPFYTTADGGIIATTTSTTITHQDPLNPVSQDPTTQVVTTNLGTLYTVDNNGTMTEQSPDTGALYSWQGEWYSRFMPSRVMSVELPIVELAATYAATFGGNLSRTGAAIKSVNQEVRDKITRVALSKVGSQHWLDQAGNNKCNIFVHDVLKEAGTTPPESDKFSFAHRAAFYLGRVDSRNFPAQAGDWANPNKTLGCWKNLDISVMPSNFIGPQPSFPADISGPGDVIAEAIQYSDATGHVGFVTGPQKTVSADSAVNCYDQNHPPAGTITISDYGFRLDSWIDSVTDPFTGRPCRSHGYERHAVVKRFVCN